MFQKMRNVVSPPPKGGIKKNALNDVATTPKKESDI